MIRRLYKKVSDLAHHRFAGWWLFAVSFAESSFFPLPPDTMLVPMVLTNPQRAWWFATLCTVASVAGGVVGYALGAWLYSSVGHWLVAVYGMAHELDTFRDMYARYGAWIILLKGFTPIPYKLVTIASGLAGYPLFTFIALSVVTRGVRFYLLTWLLIRFGEPIREQMEKHMERILLLLLVCTVVGFFAFKLLF